MRLSYGSHLGLTIIRAYPDRVERAVLGLVEGPDHTVKLPRQIDEHLTKMSEVIAADPVVNVILPNVEDLVRGLIAQLDATPRRVRLKDGRPIWLTGFMVRQVVAGSIVRRQFLRLLPAILGPIRWGDYGPLAEVGSGALTINISPMRGAMDCSPGVSPARWEQVQEQRPRSLLGEALDFPYPDACGAWAVDDLGDAFRGPVMAPSRARALRGPQAATTNRAATRSAVSPSMPDRFGSCLGSARAALGLHRRGHRVILATRQHGFATPHRLFPDSD